MGSSNNLMTYWSVSSQVLAEEAGKLGLGVEILVPQKNLFVVSSARKSVLFKSTDFGANSSLASKVTDDKELAYALLARYGMPIPKTAYVSREDAADLPDDAFAGFRFPLVAKPVDGAHGHGVRMGIASVPELRQKLAESFARYDRMIVQEQVSGDECRVLVVLDRVLLALKRVPPSVTGDGVSTVRALIERENTTNPLRREEYRSPLSHIAVDDELESCIAKRGYALDDVLPAGETLVLRGNSNLGTGGTAEDITDLLHEDTRRLCRDVAKRFWFGICGIDLLSSDFSKPLGETGGVILEINDTPGLGGDRELTSVNTGREILRLLFADDLPAA